MKEFEAGVLNGAREENDGIEAFSKPEIEELSDGRIRVTVTRYFPDINKVKISGQATSLPGGSNDEDEDDAGPPTPLLSMTLRDGNTATILYLGQMTDIGRASGLGLEADLHGKARRQEHAEQKEVWLEFTKPMMTALFDGLSLKEVIVAPGKVVKSKGFEKGDDGNPVLAVTDKEFVAAREAVLAGGALSVEEEDAIMQKTTLGTTEQPALLVELADAPHFDYAAEVAAALKSGGERLGEAR